MGKAVVVDTTVDFGVTLPADGAAHNTFTPFGITTEKLYAGTWGRVMAREGAVLNAVAAAAVARGAWVTCNSAAGANKGKLITATAGGQALGFAFTAAGALDAEFKVFISRARNA